MVRVLVLLAVALALLILGCARAERCQRPDVVAGQEGVWVVQSWCMR